MTSASASSSLVDLDMDDDDVRILSASVTPSLRPSPASPPSPVHDCRPPHRRVATSPFQPSFPRRVVPGARAATGVGANQHGKRPASELTQPTNIRSGDGDGDDDGDGVAGPLKKQRPPRFSDSVQHSLSLSSAVVVVSAPAVAPIAVSAPEPVYAEAAAAAPAAAVLVPESPPQPESSDSNDGWIDVSGDADADAEAKSDSGSYVPDTPPLSPLPDSKTMEDLMFPPLPPATQPAQQQQQQHKQKSLRRVQFNESLSVVTVSPAQAPPASPSPPPSPVDAPAAVAPNAVPLIGRLFSDDQSPRTQAVNSAFGDLSLMDESTQPQEDQPQPPPAVGGVAVPADLLDVYAVVFAEPLFHTANEAAQRLALVRGFRTRSGVAALLLRAFPSSDDAAIDLLRALNLFQLPFHATELIKECPAQLPLLCLVQLNATVSQFHALAARLDPSPPLPSAAAIKLAVFLVGNLHRPDGLQLDDLDALRDTLMEVDRCAGLPGGGFLGKTVHVLGEEHKHAAGGADPLQPILALTEEVFTDAIHLLETYRILLPIRAQAALLQDERFEHAAMVLAMYTEHKYRPSRAFTVHIKHLSSPSSQSSSLVDLNL